MKIKSPLDLAMPEGCINLLVQNKEDIAEALYNQNPFFYDSIGLFWFWDKPKKCYVQKDEIELMNLLKTSALNKGIAVTGNAFYTETIRALKLVGRSHTPKQFNKKWIQFGSSIIDYESKQQLEATPEYFNCNPIPHRLGESKETPTIDRLFAEWVGADYVLTLKEVISLAVIQDYPLHRLIILFGRGLNGKGCFLRFVVEFLGNYNVCSSSLSKLIKSNFEASKLFKKLACHMGETNFDTLNDTSLIKQLTGQDLISAEFKGKNSFDYENYALIFIASNSLPITMDKTTGFYRRPMIIDFPNQFQEGKDVLKQIPIKEYENLCLQILDILPALLERGKFDKDGTIEERMQRYEEKSNPLTLFIKNHYEKNINSDCLFYVFYDKFNLFCKERGFRELNKNNVSRLLNEMGFETKKKDVKIENYVSGTLETQWKQYHHIIGLKEVSYRSDHSDSTSTQYTIRKKELNPDTNDTNDTKTEQNSEQKTKLSDQEPQFSMENLEPCPLPCSSCGAKPSDKLKVCFDSIDKPRCEICFQYG